MIAERRERVTNGVEDTFGQGKNQWFVLFLPELYSSFTPSVLALSICLYLYIQLLSSRCVTANWLGDNRVMYKSWKLTFCIINIWPCLLTLDAHAYMVWFGWIELENCSHNLWKYLSVTTKKHLYFQKLLSELRSSSYR